MEFGAVTVTTCSFEFTVEIPIDEDTIRAPRNQFRAININQSSSFIVYTTFPCNVPLFSFFLSFTFISKIEDTRHLTNS